MSTTTINKIRNSFRTKDGNRLVINAKISKTNHLYFSITADEYEGRKKEPICGGCIHDTIMEVAPQYVDFISLHLSDIDGIPMHAVENGYYYYQHPSEYKIEVLANHLRISTDETSALITKLHSIENNAARKLYFSDFVNNQLPRWKKQATALIEKYNLTIPKINPL